MSSWRTRNASRLAESRRVCRLEKHEHLWALKKSPCFDCGGSYHVEAMTYDHRPDETKEYNIYRLLNHPHMGLERLKSELRKCDLVCVGCHRDRTNRRLPAYVTTCPQHRPNRVSGCKRCIHYSSLARLRQKRLGLVRAHKSRPCLDCGKSFDPWKMDLDHVSGKVDNVSNLVGSQASLRRIIDEIAKCEVVCCWCHVLRTVARRETDGKKRTV